MNSTTHAARIAFIICALVALFRPVRGATPIHDIHFNFSLVVPDGFEDSPKDCKQVNALYVFIKPSAKKNVLPTVIAIKKMGGVIGREPLKNVKCPDGFPAKLIAVPWKSFEISAAIIPEDVKGHKGINIVAQVPLVPEAVTVTVFGPLETEPELHALLQTVLKDLDGKSNWLTDDERAADLGKIVGIVIGLIAAYFIRRYMKKRSSANTG